MSVLNETISPNDITELKRSLNEISNGGNRKISFKAIGNGTCRNLCNSTRPTTETIIGICTKGVALCEVSLQTGL